MDEHASLHRQTRQEPQKTLKLDCQMAHISASNISILRICPTTLTFGGGRLSTGQFLTNSKNSYCNYIESQQEQKQLKPVIHLCRTTPFFITVSRVQSSPQSIVQSPGSVVTLHELPFCYHHFHPPAIYAAPWPVSLVYLMFHHKKSLITAIYGLPFGK